MDKKVSDKGIKVAFTKEERDHLKKAFLSALPEPLKLKSSKKTCECEGCSCPPGNGDICDGGTYVGYTGAYYGSSSV